MSTMVYPTNAAQLMASTYRGKDDFFLLCRVEQGQDTSIIVENDFPIAVNKENVRDAILAETGIKLPTRKEISKGPRPDNLSPQIDWTKMYTAATGGALWLTADDKEPLIYLIQNSADKPVNPNRWNFPSGLVCDNIPEQAFTEINQETGIIIPTHYGTLCGLNIELPNNLPALSKDFKDSVLVERKDQESNINTMLTLIHRPYADQQIEWLTVGTSPAYDKNLDSVSFHLLGQIFNSRAHVFVDEKAKSANIHFPMRVELTDIADARRLWLPGIRAVDPEDFRRTHGLFTLDEALKLDTIPAPRDYLQRLGGPSV